MEYRIERFDSIAEVLERLDEPRPADSGYNSQDHGHFPSESWDLNLGYEGAIKALRGGWAEGAQRAYDLASRLEITPQRSRTVLTGAVAGFLPNVPAFLAGSPESMYTTRRTATTGPRFATLVLPCSASAGVSAATLFDRGCAYAALIDGLESSGVSCAVYVLRGSSPAFFSIKIKDHGERLDIDDLIFTTAHPAFFRRIIFGLQERSRSKRWRELTHASYATPAKITRDHLDAFGFDQDAIAFPTMGQGQQKRSSPEEYLKDLVAGLPEEIRAILTAP